jgi:hypothetical protein
LAKKDIPLKNDVEEKPRETTVEFLSSLAAVLVTGLFIITFVVQAFEIPSSSSRVREPHSVCPEDFVGRPSASLPAGAPG